MPDIALPWLGSSTMPAIERRVSEYLGRAWLIRSVEDRSDAASHPAAVLSGDAFNVFVKAGRGPLARDQFSVEAQGLSFLATRARVRTPAVLGLVETGAAPLLLLEAVTPAERTPIRWHELGRALAAIHRVKTGTFGFASHTYYGDLRLDNAAATDWPTFFRDRRLLPRLEGAIRSGRLPPALADAVQRIAARLPDLCGPAVAPTLIHGDAHVNNILCSVLGPVFIDPAPCFGHPEMDLAALDTWLPVPADAWLGYQKDAAIDPGFGGRVALWRIPGWLAAVEAEGGERYIATLADAVKPYA